MKFHNPIISGFHPDPSICRAGEDYYLVTSSFEYFPGIPLFHSKDLVHWKQIGHCLTRASQVSLSSEMPNGLGIYAPTIRYHEGRFYVISTNVGGGGNFLVWTDDPYGEWSEPVWISLPGIDPSLYFDEDGAVYYTGANKSIYLCQIDVTTGAVLSEPVDVWDGTGGADPEGPHLYKIGDYYYLVISEGGTSQGHMLTAARSKKISGPYESCPRNPIMSNRSLALPVKAAGHADLVQAHDGYWWAVCLGIRPVPYPDRHHLGRETFLAPVQWDEELWPIIGNNGTIDLEMEGPLLPQANWAEKPVRDDFDEPSLDCSWNFIYNPAPGLWSLQDRQGALTLYGCPVHLDDKATSAWIGRRQQHMECTVRTLLRFNPLRDHEEAGLSIFLNCDHHYEVSLKRIEGRNTICFRRRIGTLWKVEQCIEFEQDSVILEISATPNLYSFRYAEENGDFMDIGAGEVRYLSTEVGGRFTGNFFVLYATGNGESCESPAYFEWFDYIPIVV